MTDVIDAIHGAAIDAACASDKAWFDENPGRKYNIRDPRPMEFEPVELGVAPDGYSHRVIVVHISGEARIRLIIQLPFDIPNEGAYDKALEQLVFATYPEWLTKIRKLRRTSKA